MKILHLVWLDMQKVYSIPVMSVFALIPALISFNGWFVPTAFLVYAFLVPYGLFNYDDTSIAENFYGVLPVRREQIVVARYLFALFALLLMAGLMMLVNFAFARSFGWSPLGADFLSALLLGFVCSMVFICVSFPLTMHFGAQKANGHVLAAFVTVFLFMSFYGDGLRTQILSGALGLVVFSLLAGAISCQICLVLYRKRQFFDYVPMKEVHRAKKR